MLGRPGEQERKTKLDYCVTMHLRLYLGFLIQLQIQPYQFRVPDTALSILLHSFKKLCNKIDKMQNRNKSIGAGVALKYQLQIWRAKWPPLPLLVS